MIESEFLLEFLIIPVDDPALFGEGNQIFPFVSLASVDNQYLVGSAALAATRSAATPAGGVRICSNHDARVFTIQSFQSWQATHSQRKIPCIHEPSERRHGGRPGTMHIPGKRGRGQRCKCAESFRRNVKCASCLRCRPEELARCGCGRRSARLFIHRLTGLSGTHRRHAHRGVRLPRCRDGGCSGQVL